MLLVKNCGSRIYCLISSWHNTVSATMCRDTFGFAHTQGENRQLCPRDGCAVGFFAAPYRPMCQNWPHRQENQRERQTAWSPTNVTRHLAPVVPASLATHTRLEENDANPKGVFCSAEGRQKLRNSHVNTCFCWSSGFMTHLAAMQCMWTPTCACETANRKCT